MSMGPSICPPWRSVFISFAYFLIGLFVFLVYSHMSSLYILKIKTLSNVSLANKFSHIVSSLSILMIVSLAMQKLFILMQSHLFIFPLISLALCNILAKILLCGMPEIFLSVFSSRTFMVSHFMFKSFIHFEFILAWYTLVVQIHFFTCTSPDVPITFIEKAIFTPLYAAGSFLKY